MDNTWQPEHFYVSIIDGGRYSLALGPFAVHADAIAKVDDVRDFCTGQDEHGFERFPGAWWWEFGTCRVRKPIGECPAGKLNETLGLVL